MEERERRKTQQFTTSSDYEVPENNNLDLHKQWTPVEDAELFLFQMMY